MVTRDRGVERLAYRPAEAAEALGISRAKLYQLIAKGEIPSIRLGDSIRIPAEALRRLVVPAVPEQAGLG